MKVKNVLELIGNTPIVEIRKLNPNKKVKIYAKLEKFNASGSVKDRAALSMIEEAERNGKLKKGMKIIEPTSGNTGISLAMICAVKGYKFIAVMPENVSEERKRILRAYGAEIILTPAEKGTDGAIEYAYELVRKHPRKYFMPDQYNNPANPKAHEKTAEEILRDVPELTHFVAGVGTTGTVVGVGKYLKKAKPSVKVIAVEPMPKHRIQGLKSLKASYKPGIWDRKVVNKRIVIKDEEAFEMCRKLAKKEGLLVGISSGAAMAACVKLASEIDEGVIVTIFPDGGEKYLSTGIWG
jgi:cysteinyl-tRNA synthetase